MSEYTAADFKKARFAEHGNEATVTASRDSHSERWVTSNSALSLSDEEMAERGWTPVFEYHRWAKKRERLLDHIASLEAVIRRRNEQIERQTVQMEKLESQLSEARAPLSLDSLAAAYEAAEVPTEDTPIREGDEYISTTGKSLATLSPFVVGVAGKGGQVVGWSARILSRAPQREPWQDLADKLAEVLGADAAYLESLARRLHDGGWRKTGGDES